MKPSDDMYLLALYLWGFPRASADEIRGLLVNLGFELNAQQVAAALTRLGREGLVEVGDTFMDINSYTLSTGGRLYLNNGPLKFCVMKPGV